MIFFHTNGSDTCSFKKSSIMTKHFLFMLIVYFAVGDTKPTKKPNIIFILTDDQGSADVGYRNPKTPLLTPNIDNLARESIRLENYYVHPTCSPTRAALMTSKYAINVGLPSALIPGNPAGLDPSYKILPEHLKNLGYSTHLVGKWHLGNAIAKHHPLNRGFDDFYGLLGGGFNHFTKQIGDGRMDWWRNWDPEYENVTHATELLNEEALKVVEKHAQDPDSAPFFLYLAHPAPHDPLLAPEHHQRLCAHVKNRRRRMQCAMVAGIDEGVGRLTDLMKQHNILDNTIIAFSIDNGGVPHAGALNYPLKGAKTTVLEGGVKVPGFIYAPTFFQKNNYDFEHLFHVTDFTPTFLSMIDSTSKESKPKKKAKAKTALGKIDGIDQYKALSGGGPGPRKSVHIHRDPDRDSHAYRKGAWKIIVGHHYLPFFFTEVYNETVSGRLVECGGLKDRFLELVLDIMDWTMGSQNTIFTQYLTWAIFDSWNVGGIRKVGAATAVEECKSQAPAEECKKKKKGLFQELYKSDLEHWIKKHTDDYPTVSLFNLDDDPSENNNLAFKHPEKVKELLEEAEEVIKNAPPLFRGDMVDKNAPRGPQADDWMPFLLTKASEHDEVIPFGVYMDDDFDLTKLKYERLMDNTRTYNIVIFVKVAAILIFPFVIGIIMLFKVFRY